MKIESQNEIKFYLFKYFIVRLHSFNFFTIINVQFKLYFMINMMHNYSIKC